MSVIIFLLILAAIIFVHEFGHFIAAKLSGVRVDEFAIGFPPRIFSVKKGGTNYSINLIPFGGYVKIHGESPTGEDDENDPQSLISKPKIIQAIIMFAGVFLNFVLAWLLLSIAFMIGAPVSEGQADVRYIENPEVTILEVLSDSPAEEAGLATGDRILSLSAQETKENPTLVEVQDFIALNSGENIIVEYRRGEDVYETSVVPTEGLIPERGAIGVSLDTIGIARFPVHTALWQGAVFTYDLIVATFKFTFIFIKNLFLPAVPALDSVVGPVGLAGLFGSAIDLGFVYLISLTAIISLNLGVLNLIPMPALDGGRILFILIETIKGSPIKPHIANLVNGIGFSLVIILMLVITYKDLFRIFG